ncbi:MAG: host attachment protein [Methyloligellaceae bacterium]
MKPVKTWILIGNGNQARIFRNMGPGKGVELVEGIQLNTTTPPDRDLVSDRPGRTFDSHGQGRHAMEPKNTAHRLSKKKFALEVIDLLQTRLAKREFDRLLVVAPPEMLGDLRDNYSPQILKCLIGEVDKDLTAMPTEKIPQQIGDFIAA